MFFMSRRIDFKIVCHLTHLHPSSRSDNVSTSSTHAPRVLEETKKRTRNCWMKCGKCTKESNEREENLMKIQFFSVFSSSRFWSLNLIANSSKDKFHFDVAFAFQFNFVSYWTYDWAFTKFISDLFPSALSLRSRNAQSNSFHDVSSFHVSFDDISCEGKWENYGNL